MRQFTPCLLLFVFSIYSYSQNCLNAGFENGTLDGYRTYLGMIEPDGTVVVKTEDFNANQHRIMHISDGFDPIAMDNCIVNKYLPVVSENGGNHTLRLGNVGTDAKAEKVILQFKVTPELTFFQLRYAVLLNDPKHEPYEQPRFELSIRDTFGMQLACGDYKVRAAPDIPGFENCDNGWRVLNWTTAGFELKSFLGQYIRIEILTTDCARKEHAGYAYFDATCQPLTITLDGYCPGNITANMRVTEGFQAYNWNTKDTTSAISISNPQPGEIYSVTVTSATNCTVVLQDTIPELSIFTIPEFVQESAQNFCRDTAYWFTPKGENLGAIYSYAHDTTGHTFFIDTEFSKDYTFIAQDPYNCFTDTLHYFVNTDSFSLQFTIDSISCFGENSGAITTALQSDFAPFQYEWEHGARTASIDQLAEGRYTVTVSDRINCSRVASFELNSPPPLFLEIIEGKSISCPESTDGQLTIRPIGGSLPYEIRWNTGASNTTKLEQLSVGTYSVSLTDSKGCKIENSATLSPPTALLIGAQMVPVSCYGKEDGEIAISISGGEAPYQVSWLDDPRLQTTARNNLPAGEYAVTITDEQGCTKEESMLVQSPPFNKVCGIYIPTAFTPNGDGVNDYFSVAGSSVSAEIESIQVFNRWGELVFSNEGDCPFIGDAACGWSGRMNGKDSPTGVYVYLIKLRLDGVLEPAWFSGEVSLIR